MHEGLGQGVRGTICTLLARKAWVGPCEDSGILEVTGRKGSPGAVGEGLGLWAVGSGQDSSRWRVSALPCPCGVLDTTVKSGLVLLVLP